MPGMKGGRVCGCRVPFDFGTVRNDFLPNAAVDLVAGSDERSGSPWKAVEPPRVCRAIWRLAAMAACSSSGKALLGLAGGILPMGSEAGC